MTSLNVLSTLTSRARFDGSKLRQRGRVGSTKSREMELIADCWSFVSITTERRPRRPRPVAGDHTLCMMDVTREYVASLRCGLGRICADSGSYCRYVNCRIERASSSMWNGNCGHIAASLLAWRHRSRSIAETLCYLAATGTNVNHYAFRSGSATQRIHVRDGRTSRFTLISHRRFARRVSCAPTSSEITWAVCPDTTLRKDAHLQAPSAPKCASVEESFESG